MERLHPTGPHPESPERQRVLLESLRATGRRPRRRRRTTSRAATTASTSSGSATSPGRRGSIRTQSAPTRATKARCCPPEPRRGRPAGGLRNRPPARTPRAPHARDGLLPLRERGDRRPLCAGRAWRRARGDRRLGRPPWERHAGDLRGRPERLLRIAPSVAVLSRKRWTGGAERDDAERPAPGRAGDADYLRAFAEKVEPAVAGFDPEIVIVSAGFDAHEEDPLAMMEVTEHGFLELARRSAALRPAAPPCSRADTTSRRFRGLVHAASRASPPHR